MATDNIASSVMQTLGGGSGIDIVKLARDLTDVEKLPAEEKLLPRKGRLKRRFLRWRFLNSTCSR